MQHLPKAFNGLVYGVEALQRSLARNGYAYDGFRLLIPNKLGEEIERELLATPAEIWEPYTYGIHVYADGYLKQMVLCDSMWVGWKTRATKGKSNGKPRSKTVFRAQIGKRGAK